MLRPCPARRQSAGRGTSQNRSAGQRGARLVDRRVRRFAVGEEPVADDRMARRQPPPGRRLVAAATTWRSRSVTPQCAASQASAVGIGRPSGRIAAGTGSSTCRSNGQARLCPTRAAAARLARLDPLAELPRQDAAAGDRQVRRAAGWATARTKMSSSMRRNRAATG